MDSPDPGRRFLPVGCCPLRPLRAASSAHVPAAVGRFQPIPAGKGRGGPLLGIPWPFWPGSR